MRRDPLVEIEVGIQADKAASLGHAGRRLRAAVAALARAPAHERRAQLHLAADALWAYIVQREALGLTDHAVVSEAYGVSSELWRRMGAREFAA